MISKISIQNFKSLKNVELECSNLNLLTGLNGMGKSSIIQALLLLRQSFDKGYLKKDGLMLKGDLVNIGTGKEALNTNADRNEISLSISFDKQNENKWILGYEINKDGIEQKYYDSDVLPFGEETLIPNDIDSLPLFTSKFKYLNAERWVKNQYEMSEFHVVQNRSLGKHGEFTAHYLVYFGSKTAEQVPTALMYPGTEAKELDYQVSAWMNEVSPGTKVNAVKIPGLDTIKLSYGKEEFAPTNMGFGITYSLPVIVALLSAKPGDILVIENPESHVHPQGQSAIGRLIGIVAQLGVQIFVESHSDHVLNGICVAIHDGQLQKENAKFYFLHKKHSETDTTKYEVVVGNNGRIDDRDLKEAGVMGFFDQMNKDLESILFTPAKNN